MTSRTATRLVLLAVIVIFVISWIFKSSSIEAESSWVSVREGFFITFAAFLTLAIFSFLYKDNPFYKFAEHLYVGISAAFWMCQGFWGQLVGSFIPYSSRSLSEFFEVEFQDYRYHYYLAVALGILLLMRLVPRVGWLSRWSLAFIIGTTAGLNLPRYLRSDFMSQINNTFQPLFVDWQGVGSFVSNFSLSASGQFVLSFANWVIVIGVLCGLIYFFFSKEHKGLFGSASRVGIWVLMITFGASFGYTVMGRISLLIGRVTFLFQDWLNIL
jgi:hypothetical protein